MSNIFEAAFDKTVQVAEVDSADGAGRRTYGSPVNIDARVERKREEIVDSEGDQVVSEYILYMDEGKAPSLDARVWLPDEDPSTDPGHGPLSVGKSTGILVNANLVKVIL